MLTFNTKNTKNRFTIRLMLRLFIGLEESNQGFSSFVQGPKEPEFLIVYLFVYLFSNGAKNFRPIGAFFQDFMRKTSPDEPRAYLVRRTNLYDPFRKLLSLKKGCDP